jgi:hypothetical protein
MRWNFFLRERLDKWLQAFVAAKVFCPTLFYTESRGVTKFEKVPLIVRKQFLKPECQRGSSKIGILGSGSGWDVNRLAKIQENHSDICEWIKMPKSKSITTAADLGPYQTILCQGGMSSISECVSLNKFMVVLPIANHAEQYVNAVMIERLGLGVSGETSELPKFPAKNVERKINCRGAQVLVNRLLAHTRAPGFSS